MRAMSIPEKSLSAGVTPFDTSSTAVASKQTIELLRYVDSYDTVDFGKLSVILPGELYVICSKSTSRSQARNLLRSSLLAVL